MAAIAQSLYFGENAINILFPESVQAGDARYIADEISHVVTAVTRAARALVLKSQVDASEDVCAALAGAELLGNFSTALRFHADFLDEMVRSQPKAANAVESAGGIR